MATEKTTTEEVPPDAERLRLARDAAYEVEEIARALLHFARDEGARLVRALGLRLTALSEIVMAATSSEQFDETTPDLMERLTGMKKEEAHV